MARKQRSGLTRHFRRLIGQLLTGRSGSNDRSKAGRYLSFEPLEDRQLMASDLASISGLVSSGGPVVGATVNLYVDDGDGIFEPGAGDGAATVDTTDGAGTYRFDGLVAGAYWIEQPAQTVGSTVLGQFVAPLINISAGQAAGVLGTSIDDYADAVAQVVTADSGTPTNSGAADHPGAIGGERDMIVTLTSGGSGESVILDSQSGRLQFNSSLAAQGDFTIVYDGDDNDALTLAATGLGGVNLTAGSATSIKAQVQADQANATFRIRVYTNATDFSDSSTFTIPGTNVATDVVFDFLTDFGTGAGATNPANFSSVGAIEVLVETNTDGTDGRVNLLGAFGPTVITQDITNELDLAIQKNVDDSTPGSGQPVTFTIDVTNTSASQTATNVVLTDTFDFTTLSGVVTTPQGGTNFVLAGDNQSGTWTIPTLAPGATATLIITGNNISVAQRTNTIALTSLDQIDTNSANDSDSEVLTPTTLDLVVDKQVNDATPNNGQAVTFTMTVTNSSATEAATNVVLTDTFDFTTLSGIVTTPQAGTNFVLAGNNQSGTWTIPSLAPGATATLIITGNNNSAAQRTNTITLTSLDQFDTNDANNSDSQQLTPNTLDLVVDKQVNDATPNNGQSITFTMTVTNSSATEAATNVVLTDTFDFTTLSGVVTTPQAGTNFVLAGNNQSGTWTIPTLAPGAVATLTITGNNISAAQRTNTIALTSLDQFDTDGANNSDNQQLTPNTLDLVVDKQVNDSTPNNGQSITFTMTVTNSSATETATNIVLTDTFNFTTLSGVTSNAQAGTTFVIAGNNQSGTWTIPTLAPGATATLTITGNNISSAQRTNTIALASLDQFDTNAQNNTDGAQLTPNTLDLVVGKQVTDNTPNKNQSITFTMTVTNSSATETATNVVLTDTFDFTTLSGLVTTPQAGTNFVLAGNNQSGTWTIPTLAPGAAATLTITGNNNSATQRTNTITLTTLDQFDTSAANNTASQQLTPTRADLRLAKTVIGPTAVEPGHTVTFRLTLTNDGPDQATGVAVTDTLPAGLSFVNATASQGSFANGVWSVGTLNSGASATLDIVATLTTTGPKTNVAEVTASDQFDPDSTPGDNTGDDRATANVTSTRLSKRRFLAR